MDLNNRGLRPLKLNEENTIQVLFGANIQLSLLIPNNSHLLWFKKRNDCKRRLNVTIFSLLRS